MRFFYGCSSVFTDIAMADVKNGTVLYVNLLRRSQRTSNDF